MADIRIKDLAVTASSSASDDYLAVDGSANGTRKLSAYSPTFGGNLTVSGTGTISGALSTTDVITNTVNSQEQFVLVKPVTGTFSPQQIVFKQYDANSASQTVATINTYKTTNTAGAIDGQLVLVTSNAGTPTAALTLDSSQTATFAGQVNILNSNSYLKADSSNLVYETYAGKGHQFKTGGTTALTLDSSQNATFVGSVSIGNSDTTLSRASAQTLQLNTSSTPQFSLSVNGTQKARLESYSDDLYISTLTAGKSIILRSGNATTALTLDSSQNATFAGSIAIGNTVNTVSPTSPNRTITMVIGGTTYYIHAKTTND